MWLEPWEEWGWSLEGHTQGGGEAEGGEEARREVRAEVVRGPCPAFPSNSLLHRAVVPSLPAKLDTKGRIFNDEYE